MHRKLDSRNGVFVDEERITEPQLLSPGDTFRLSSNIVLRYDMIGLPVEAEQADPTELMARTGLDALLGDEDDDVTTALPR